jgi:hypothetical protein
MEPFTIKVSDFTCEVTKDLTRTKIGSGNLGYIPVYTDKDGACLWDTLKDSIITQNSVDDTITIGGNLMVNLNVTHGSSDATRTTINSSLFINGPIYDSVGQIGAADQILVSLTDGRVMWSNDNNTTYDLRGAVDNITDFAIGLIGSDGSLDKVYLRAGTNITLTDDGLNGVTIDSVGMETYTNLTPTPQDFPGGSPFDNIPVGSTFNGNTITEMFDMMLYPELFPTLVNPGSTFTLAQDGFREIGGTIVQLDFTANFTRGSITPAYTTNGFRSGLPNAYNYTGTGLTTNVPSTSLTDLEVVGSYTVLLGTQSWTATVAYDAGQQPLSSAGNPYSTLLPAGNTNTDTVSIVGVYPTFATTISISTLTQQPLQSMGVLIQVSMVAESGLDKQVIDIPTAWVAITGLEQFNTISNVWDPINLATFTTSVTTHMIQGISVNYTKYTYNGATIGARQLRFTI